MDKEDRTVCSSALLAGMIIGQIAVGTLGDTIGRHKAMTLVIFLQIFAACGSELSTAISYDFNGLSADNSWMSNIYSLRMSIYNVLSGKYFLVFKTLMPFVE
jgi:MFS family permease